MEVSDFFQFHKFLAPVLIKIVYWIGLFFIVLSTLASMFGMGQIMAGYQSGFSLGGALVSLLLGILCALVWRVMCEIWIVVFSINDRLGMLTGELPRKLPPTA